MADEPDPSQFAHHPPVEDRSAENAKIAARAGDRPNPHTIQPKSTQGRSIFDTGAPWPRRRTPSIRLL